MLGESLRKRLRRNEYDRIRSHFLHMLGSEKEEMKAFREFFRVRFFRSIDEALSDIVKVLTISFSS